ncbi:MAG: hypothetical protein Q9225_000836 [Loekoesia sp. 1 TL-2023]
MGKELFHQCSEFRRSIIESDNILQDIGSSWSLIDELYMAGINFRINEAEVAQPAIIAIQIALVNLLASIDVQPQTVIGHSSGEIAAAYTARALCHRTALRVAYSRGSLPKLCKQSIERVGAMLSVGLGEADILPYISRIEKGLVSIACLNSPSSSTVSGDEDAIHELAEVLTTKAVFNRKLKVDAAYHSHHMRHVAQDYRGSLGDFETCQVRDDIAFISSVSATKKQEGFATSYWVDNLVSQVRFLDALVEYRRCSLDYNYPQPARHLLIEIGPHSALQGPIRQTYGQKRDDFDYLYAPTLERGRDNAHSILELVGKLFTHGYPVNLQKVCGSKYHGCPRIMPTNLPHYVWDHEYRYWYESQLSKEYRRRQYGSHDLLGVRVVKSPPEEPRWRRLMSLADTPWLSEHVIDGLITFPGAAYLCMAVEALRQITSCNASPCNATYVLRDVVFIRALIVPQAPGKLEIQLSFRFDDRALQCGAQEPYVVHPATLDSFMHTSLPIYAALCKAKPIMPVAIEQLQISSDITADPMKELTVYTELKQPVYTYALANAAVFDSKAPTARLVLAIDGIKILGVNNPEDSAASASETRKMGYKVQWAKDIDFVGTCWNCSRHGHLPSDLFTRMLLAASIQTPQQKLEIEQDQLDWLPGKMNKASLRSSNYHECNALPECGFSNYDLVLIVVKQHMFGLFTERIGTIRGMLKFRGHLLIKVDRTICDSTHVSDFEERLRQQDFNLLTYVSSNESGHDDDNILRVYRAAEDVPTSSKLPLVVVSDKRHRPVSCSIGNAFRQKGVQCSMSTWDTLRADSAGTYSFVCDSYELGLCDANATGFERLKNMLTTMSKIVWVVSSAGSSSPDSAVLLGLMRTACSEYEQLRTVVFDVQEVLEDCLPQLLQPITDAVFQMTHLDTHTGRPFESEYTFTNGHLLIPRLFPSTEVNDIVSGANGHPHSMTLPCTNKCGPSRLSNNAFCADGEVCFERGESVFDELSADEQKQPRAESTSSRVNLQEFAGTVIKVGQNIQKDYRVGDLVYGWSLDTSSCASDIRCKAQQICHIPGHWDMALAAASPSAIITAYHTLVEVAGLQRSQTILINGYDCPVTQAAIMLSKQLGAEVVVSGVSTSQRDLLVEICNFPSSQVLVVSGARLDQRLHDLLGQDGVDVILSTSTAPSSDLWACIAAFGTIIQIVNDGSKTSVPGGPLATGRPFTFVAFDLVSTLRKQPRKIEGVLKKAQDVIQIAKPERLFPSQKISMGRSNEAMATARTRSNLERIILEADSDVQVIVSGDFNNYSNHSVSRMDKRTTYVVAGGLGDIGYIICRLMASLGAENIVILSRRILEDQERECLQKEIHRISLSTNLHIIPCDISNCNDMVRAAQIIRDQNLPPVRGVIQAATVLDDGTLERMTADKFRIPLLTKVKGTRHLHQVFSTDSLDYFLMLSSLSGIIGSRGQGNYVAGNIVIGLDGRALREAESATSVSRSPRFNHVREWRPEPPREADVKAKASLRTLISEARSTVDACRHVTLALSVKLAQLISLNQERLPVDVPLTDFGLDSLTAVDLKSWIQNECDATVQPSEILDQPNLESLGLRIVSRSGIVYTGTSGPNPNDRLATGTSPYTITDGLTDTLTTSAHRDKYTGVERPPPLPLNDLSKTLDTFLGMAEPFLTTEAMNAMRGKAQDFKTGAGAKLQQHLSAREQDANIGNWQHGLQVSGVYLTRRQPVHPYGTFYFSHLAAKGRCTQSIKAAIVSAAAHLHRIKLAMNQIEPD